MPYRIVQITKPSECHITNHHLIIEQEEGTADIPLEDIQIVICIGAKIRFSTMGLSELAKEGIVIVNFGKKHELESIIEPYYPNARHAKMLFEQIEMEDVFKKKHWDRIVKVKISNQAKNLAVLGLEGFERISSFEQFVQNGDKDNIEALAASEYFQFYHKGLNRRTDDPVNSALNYGYAIIRSYIIKALITTGFHCALGIHHHNDYNSFNLADDMIEPWRAMVDQMAYRMTNNDILLNSKERKEIIEVLHCNCKIGGKKMWIATGIELMADSLKAAIMKKDPEKLELPLLTDFR